MFPKNRCGTMGQPLDLFFPSSPLRMYENLNSTDGYNKFVMPRTKNATCRVAHREKSS